MTLVYLLYIIFQTPPNRGRQSPMAQFSCLCLGNSRAARKTENPISKAIHQSSRFSSDVLPQSLQSFSPLSVKPSNINVNTIESYRGQIFEGLSLANLVTAGNPGDFVDMPMSSNHRLKRLTSLKTGALILLTRHEAWLQFHLSFLSFRTFSR